MKQDITVAIPVPSLNHLLMLSWRATAWVDSSDLRTALIEALGRVAGEVRESMMASGHSAWGPAVALGQASVLAAKVAELLESADQCSGQH